MDPERLFSIANGVALVGWLLLVLVPRWRASARLVASVLVPGLLAALYLTLVVTHFGDGEGGFGSLEQVAALFRNPWALLAGWVHYLALDLFIGAWEVRDAQRSGIHHLLVVPCLLLTFMLGPVGLLLYLVVRAAVRRKVWIDEQGGAAA